MNSCSVWAINYGHQEELVRVKSYSTLTLEAKEEHSFYNLMYILQHRWK